MQAIDQAQHWARRQRRSPLTLNKSVKLKGFQIHALHTTCVSADTVFCASVVIGWTDSYSGIRVLYFLRVGIFSERSICGIILSLFIDYFFRLTAQGNDFSASVFINEAPLKE